MANETGSEYTVTLLKDKETGQIVAKVPTLHTSDYGLDSRQALGRLHGMVEFHLECLLAEGKQILQDKKSTPGLFLRVKSPVGST